MRNVPLLASKRVSVRPRTKGRIILSCLAAPVVAGILVVVSSTAARAQHVPCTSDAQCTDNNVCNGIESCEGTCIPGAPLNCDDGDVCTTDSCDPTLGCQHAANTADAVTGLLAESQTSFAWNPIAGEGVSYDVARGQIGEWPPGSGAGESCLAMNTTATSVTDTDPLPEGAGYWYLVRSRTACETGSFGEGGGGITVCG